MSERQNSLPEFVSLDALVEFFDTRDLGGYLDQMPEAYFDVVLQPSTRWIPAEEETEGICKETR